MPKQPLPPLPGDGLLGWLGRQIGHVKKAVQTDVTPPPPPAYRNVTVKEEPMPGNPSLILRRTTVDEVVATKEATKDSLP